MNIDRIKQIEIMIKEIGGYGTDRAHDEFRFLRYSIPKAMNQMLAVVKAAQDVVDGTHSDLVSNRIWLKDLRESLEALNSGEAR